MNRTATTAANRTKSKRSRSHKGPGNDRHNTPYTGGSPAYLIRRSIGAPLLVVE